MSWGKITDSEGGENAQAESDPNGRQASVSNSGGNSTDHETDFLGGGQPQSLISSGLDT